MSNLRLLKIKVADSNTILAKFTDELDQFINTSNVVIESNLPSVPNPKVLNVSVTRDVLIITTQPMTPSAAYFVTFKSSSLTKFKSKNGTAFLLEDGTTNVPLVLGAEDPADPIRSFLTDILHDSVYNLDPGTVVRDIINSQATNLSKGLHDIGQAKNDNYLSRTIFNESKTRGTGPFDRLGEEGAYEIIRVSTSATPGTLSNSLKFDSFPADPITLQTIPVNKEILTAGDSIGNFNGLVLTVINHPVIKLKKVTIIYSNGSIFNYNVRLLGYQINNPRYDQDFASTLLTLSDSQFKLSDIILSDPAFVSPRVGDTIMVDYEYKNLGRVITENSIVISQILNSIREVAPPILTKFSLAHVLVVTTNDVLAISNGIQFLDPNSNPPFSATHPAFTKELPFRFDGLPSSIGEFAVDYNTGTVYVYGATTNDGTGDFPPAMNYFYRNIFDNRLDYTYDPDSLEIISSPLRDLTGQTAKISFIYEDSLVPGVDFNPQIHTEVLDERVQNRVNNTNSLASLNSPITNVFRIFNKTTGEVYRIQRWNDNTIFFTANSPPKVFSVTRERATFTDVSNETLIVDAELFNASNVRIFRILLENNAIISVSEDAIGSSYNSSVFFSRNDVFSKELYFDAQILTVTENIDKLIVGQYLVDYRNGIIYVSVISQQDYDLGTVNYKKPVISPANSHVTSVSMLYNSIDTITGINKNIGLLSFSEGAITPVNFDISDERFLNGDTTLPYIVLGNTITVSDDIKNVRNIFDAFDLNNHVNPTNFAEGSISDANVIVLANSVAKQEVSTVQNGLTVPVSFISVGAEIAQVTSVVRLSDNIELFDGGGSFSNFDITLSGLSGSPLVGDVVSVNYTVKLNGAATPIVDYNRGDYFVDYIYLADEILISYEYGDNVLDFRQSDTLEIGTNYFVTYKVGALRDSLLKNFGSLVDVSILNTFDTSLPRENYRDALTAALQSFTKGPTIPSMKALVSNITHIDPEILEAVFQNWSLGVSHLYPNPIDWTNGLKLMTGKFDNGVLVTSSNETVTFPISSNLRLEEGTLETWIIPEWDGLDNDATLTFSHVLKDGNVLSSNSIYIGADSHHPAYTLNNEFSINKTDLSSPIGLPSAIFTQTGLFIYYDDIGKRWKVLAKDAVTDGYVYQGTVISSGEVYDVKFIPGLGEIDDVLRSGLSKIEFVFNIDVLDAANPDGYVDGYDIIDGYIPADGYQPGYSYDGMDFMADDEHYIFDFGRSESTDRFSLFKDGRGYLNFRVYDKGNKTTNKKNQYKVSADISSWKAGQAHHVGITWRLNSDDKRDEMHLFVDGFEVPNIMRYGGRPQASTTDRFRTVKPEIVIGTVPLNTIVGNDLNTTIGSSVVFSNSTDFLTEGIVPGNTIEIREMGFGTYTILSVGGFNLTLDSPAPNSLTNARYSVNPFSAVVSSEIDLFANIAVSIIRNGVETEIPGLRADVPAYDISVNALNQNVLTILGDAQAGDQIAVRTLGLNHRRCRDRQFNWGNTSNILKTQLPSPINLDEVKIIAVMLPLVQIGPNNASLISGSFHGSLSSVQPSNTLEGRTLSIKITGGNVDFSVPVQVIINGDVVETITFNTAGTKNTLNKFKTITSINIVVKPIIISKNSIAIEVKEAYAITYSEGNNMYPVIRFSYKTQTGTHLQGTSGSSIVTDNSGFFPASSIGQILIINSPPSVAGSYSIIDRIDDNNIVVSSNLAATFSNGSYDIFNVSLGRSGFQNGFFTLEQAGKTNTAFTLNQGYFDFDYSAYLEITIDPWGTQLAHVGSDLNNHKQAKAIIDDFVILSNRLTDVRIGESIGPKQESITTDFTRIRPLVASSNTLMLLHFDTFPLINSADFWVTAEKEFLQSDSSVNSSFDKCLVINDTPLIVDNKGLLTTTSEGTIEFWVSPKYDTYNDPNVRFYFDASGSIVEELTSITRGTVKVSNRVSSVVSVTLQSASTENFFAGGTVGPDFQTLKLAKALPYQRTPVKVNYIPSGLAGDRISIYKDAQGYITFNVRAKGVDYQVRQPVFWEQGSWHRVMATYKFNRSDNLDEIRLFVDGEERGTILFGQNLFFGQSVIFGQGFAGVNNSILVDDINFRDPINQFFIGSDYLSTHTAYARIDNLRLSNAARRPLLVAGQAKDINFSSNTDVTLPVIPDAVTTYLLDFNTLISKTTDLALLRDEQFGIFNFTLDIIDSFGIVMNNPKIKQVLEDLISALKPAQSRVTINYFK